MQHRTIEEELALTGRALSWTVGVSMEPLLHHRRSTVVIEPPHGPLKRGDVALYRNARNDYVLHRVIGTAAEGYVIRGDNCYWKETVPLDKLVGVMAGPYPPHRGANHPPGPPPPTPHPLHPPNAPHGAAKRQNNRPPAAGPDPSNRRNRYTYGCRGDSQEPARGQYDTGGIRRE